jgi:hypothetical protein
LTSILADTTDAQLVKLYNASKNEGLTSFFDSLLPESILESEGEKPKGKKGKSKKVESKPEESAERIRPEGMTDDEWQLLELIDTEGYDFEALTALYSPTLVTRVYQYMISQSWKEISDWYFIDPQPIEAE